MMRTTTALGVAFLALLGGVVARAQESGERSAAALFERHCAACHDADGRAAGPVARLLQPAPRDFGLGLFQLTTGPNGVASAADVERVLERGIAGSGMPSFHWLDAADRAALAQHVLDLAVAARTAQILQQARARGVPVDEAGARATAVRRLTAVILPELGPFPEPTADTLERGQQLYREQCAACHGPEGRGRGAPDAWIDTEFPFARNLGLGLLKGGASLDDLARRIRAGMPGRGMPPTLLENADIAAIAVYVRTLIPPGAEQRFAQRRHELRARKVAAPAPADPGDAAWEGADEVRLVLSPLAGRAASVLEARIAVLHDGSDVAVRLSWSDATKDDRAVGASRLPDGAALQWSTEAEPAFFGMGSSHQPVNLWHWKAFHPDDLAGALDLLLPQGSGTGAASDVPRVRAPEGLLTPETSGESATGSGPGRLAAPADARHSIAAAPRWHDGTWQVVFKRSLAATTAGEVALAEGARLQLAAAIWNGSAGDYGAQKSVSLWNGVTLER